MYMWGSESIHTAKSKRHWKLNLGRIEDAALEGPDEHAQKDNSEADASLKKGI
jgi:hypothetical protein